MIHHNGASRDIQVVVKPRARGNSQAEFKAVVAKVFCLSDLRREEQGSFQPERSVHGIASPRASLQRWCTMTLHTQALFAQE